MKNKFQHLFIREKVVRAIREFFYNEKFHEVETPLLVPAVIPESYLEYFETYLLDRNRKKKKVFLTTSPEASLKKLLVAGIGNCFEITRSFRNTESGSTTHNPEFTILEWYRIGAKYFDIIKDCEQLILHIHQSLSASQLTISNLPDGKTGQQLAIIYQGNSIDLSPPWPRISVPEALKRFSNISFEDITKREEERVEEMFPLSLIAPCAQKKGYRVKSSNSWEEVFNQIYLNEIEPHLKSFSKPVVIYDFPRPMAALAKLKDDDTRLCERFEFYIGGQELGDCYTELTEWKEQQDRFGKEQVLRKKHGKTDVIADREFINALKKGLPSCSGIAVGVDRLAMLFADTPKIQDVLLFSHFN